MDVRQRTEEIEHMTFAPWATFSDQSRGRMLPEEQDPIRPVFQRDRDRVLHCKAFRRLKQKTQVFLSPEGDLYRTRLTHTLEVSQIARTIARALRLNEDLTEAISLAHDLGHTPFGHAGERALNELCPDGFKHYMQSLRVVDKLEKDGRGLNLTWEVRNGIVTHTKGTWAATPEGRIVRMADQIAYVNHDIEDAVRAGVLDPATLPKECTAVLGQTKSARITTMINSILANSDGDVKVGAEENEAFLALRDFMYATVYVDKTAKRAIPIQTVKEIKDLDLSKDAEMAFVRDLYLMSFDLRGISFVDLALLETSQLKNGYLIYARQKTRQKLEIKWEKQMQEIVDRHHVKGSRYLLPILSEERGDIRRQYLNALHRMNVLLKKIGRLVNCPIPLTTYTARHCWASAAYRLNIPTPSISQALGHDSEKTTRIYLDSLDNQVIDDANLMVMRAVYA